MIGNGFDLEHGLPTKYEQFLAFIRKFTTAYNEKYCESILGYAIEDPYLKEIFNNPAYKDRINALHAFTENNLWLKYFEEISGTFSDDKKNWIDFENEISMVIQTMDDLINLYNDIEVNGVEQQQRALLCKCDEKLSKILDGDFIDADGVRVYIPTLLNDLNRLIGALEIYIFDYVGNQKIEYYNPDINEIQPDKVLSFNYSDTYRRLYLFHRSNYECSFIHGMAKNNISAFRDKKDAPQEEFKKCMIQSTEENNMVLGINEYLPEERKSKELDFIAFKSTINAYIRRMEMNTKNGCSILRSIQTKTENHIPYIFSVIR